MIFKANGDRRHSLYNEADDGRKKPKHIAKGGQVPDVRSAPQSNASRVFIHVAVLDY